MFETPPKKPRTRPENKAAKKTYPENLKKEYEMLKEENSRLLSLLEAYVIEVNKLRHELELKEKGVTKLE